jgi:hypothetical protein
MTITITIDAQPSGYLFAANAFDTAIGNTIRLKGYVHTGQDIHDLWTPAVIVGAKVIDGGNRAQITLEVDDATRDGIECGHWSHVVLKAIAPAGPGMLTTAAVDLIQHHRLTCPRHTTTRQED